MARCKSLACLCVFNVSVGACRAPAPTGANELPQLSYQSKAHDSYFTIKIENRLPVNVSLSLGSDVGSPTPIHDPPPAALMPGRATAYVFAHHWAGRITVGQATAPLDPRGSKIEGSFWENADVDVSYVDGYSVPIVCTDKETPFTGCSLDLFADGGSDCPETAPGPVCYNVPPEDNVDGPAQAFFAPCAGAAYTYPNDNMANRAEIQGGKVNCCIGSLCPAHRSQTST